MNYFPFNVGDYAAHTGHLEPMEDLAYRRLLDQYYMREGPLPADIEATAKLVRMRSMKADVESVLNEFFTLTDDGWTHSRCDAEIEKMQDKQAKARASGLASANARSKALQASAERALMSAQEDAERSFGSYSTNVQLPTPTPTPTPTPSSVAIATDGAGAPPSAVDVIFANGIPLLTASGVSEKNARSMLGLMRKTHGDSAVVDALARMAEEKPLQPVPWLQAALKAKTRVVGKHAGFASKDYRQGVLEDGSIEA